MSPLLFRIVIGILLIIHGFAHWNITTAWGTKPAVYSWVLSPRGVAQASLDALSNPLWVSTLLLFIAAGISIFFGVAWWRWLAIIAAAASLVAIGLFGQSNMILGIAIDVAILVALLGARWPSPSLLGA
jgi:hypothetical protein